MRIGCIVLCRYNSSRLPGKILKEINGRTVLSYIIENLLQVFKIDDIVVATSDQDTDYPIINFCNENKIHYYRGSLDNVSNRFLQCADFFGFDYAVRINGDNIFVNLSSLRKMIQVAYTNKYVFLSNVKGRTYPKGMSVEIVEINYYKNIYLQFSSNEDYEHVTHFLYKLPNTDKYYFQCNEECLDMAGIQLALDTEEDFKRINQIILNLHKEIYACSLSDIYIEYINYEKSV